MKGEIIESTDELRVVWYFAGTTTPYVLEVNDLRKGWVPLILFDDPKQAVETMRSLIRSSEAESKAGRDFYVITPDQDMVKIKERRQE